MEENFPGNSIKCSISQSDFESGWGGENALGVIIPYPLPQTIFKISAFPCVSLTDNVTFSCFDHIFVFLWIGLDVN